MKLIVAIVAVVLVASAAHAQSWGRGGAYTGASPRAGYYPRSGTHWCQWSAATVCGRWRANGGRYPADVCPPGNNSTSCRLQRQQEARRSR
jgi:hypothetical protein